jgi:hypothetical protein
MDWIKTIIIVILVLILFNFLTDTGPSSGFDGGEPLTEQIPMGS